ncbi:hypothetical protein [Frankia sp. Cr2]|uniref:hypothetical protein n=1 Tax=Frankia sp. Cr2 TaxID=3073932 RepID=UPI002AD5953A|nr:hypothetical protein [Frankia sp. Cr2]
MKRSPGIRCPPWVVIGSWTAVKAAWCAAPRLPVDQSPLLRVQEGAPRGEVPVDVVQQEALQVLLALEENELHPSGGEAQGRSQIVSRTRRTTGRGQRVVGYVGPGDLVQRYAAGEVEQGEALPLRESLTQRLQLVVVPDPTAAAATSGNSPRPTSSSTEKGSSRGRSR